MSMLKAYKALGPEQSPALQGFMTKVYAWMCGGLALATAIGFYLFQHLPYLRMVVGQYLPWSIIGGIGLLGGWLALWFVLPARLGRLSSQAATAMYLLYSALNGLLLVGVFKFYKLGAIGILFAVGACMFGAMSAYGALTKRDLGSWRSLLFMGGIGLVIVSVINIWLKSPGWTWLFSLGVMVLVIGPARETQEIRQLALAGDPSTQNIGMDRPNAAIKGALTLSQSSIIPLIIWVQVFGHLF